jgi:hypothetical protein
MGSSLSRSAPPRYSATKSLYLLPAVHLLPVEFGLQVVQLVGIGFAGLDRGAVVVLERRLHRLGVVGEVEHEGVVLLRMRPVQA